MSAFSEEQRKIFQEPNYVSVASLGKDGTARNTAIWVDIEGDEILLNGTPNRAWLINLMRNPSVALCIYDMKNPYQQVNVIGEVVDITEKGAEEHIDKLARKYTGKNYSAHSPEEPRRIARVKANKVTGTVK